MIQCRIPSNLVSLPVLNTSISLPFTEGSAVSSLVGVLQESFLFKFIGAVSVHIILHFVFSHVLSIYVNLLYLILNFLYSL